MPKKVTKAVKNWPAPKRGKARSLMKSSKASSTAGRQSVPYVRCPGVQKLFDKRRGHCNRSVPMLAAMKGGALIRLLRDDGLLQKWEGQKCPSCSKGMMGQLYLDKGKSTWVHRCSAKACQKRLQPHDFNPIFFVGHGSTTPLALQASILSCALAGVPTISVPALLDLHRKPVEKIYNNLEVARARHVLHEEPKIVFGHERKWPDVEADEVDLGKEEFMTSGRQKKVRWEQWGGMVERGRPQTLVLYRLHPKLTRKRAPGPGPISRMDWAPIAKNRLAKENVVLHTDCARAYKMAIPGVIHDNVVHKKKRVLVRGKYMWIKPSYAKVYKHKLPDGKVITGKSGTQDHRPILGDSATRSEAHPPTAGYSTAAQENPCSSVAVLAQRPQYVAGHWCHGPGFEQDLVAQQTGKSSFALTTSHTLSMQLQNLSC